jgi:hypothetical protein
LCKLNKSHREKVKKETKKKVLTFFLLSEELTFCIWSGQLRAAARFTWTQKQTLQAY